MSARDYFRNALDLPDRGRGKWERVKRRQASRSERHEVHRWLADARLGMDQAGMREPLSQRRVGHTPQDLTKLDACCVRWAYGRIPPMGVEHRALVAQARAAFPRSLRHEARACVERALATLTRDEPADRLRVRDEFGALSVWPPWREAWFREAQQRANDAWVKAVPEFEEPTPAISESEAGDG